MIGAIQSAVSGMESASRVVDKAAANIARGSTAQGSNIAEDAVNMTVGSRLYDANAKVVEVAAKMLDVFA